MLRPLKGSFAESGFEQRGGGVRLSALGFRLSALGARLFSTRLDSSRLVSSRLGSAPLVSARLPSTPRDDGWEAALAHAAVCVNVYGPTSKCTSTSRTPAWPPSTNSRARADRGARRRLVSRPRDGASTQIGLWFTTKSSVAQGHFSGLCSEAVSSSRVSEESWRICK